MSCHITCVRRQFDIICGVLFFRIEQLVLQEKDRVGPAQRGIDEQPAYIVPVAAVYNSETGYRCEQMLWTLAMRGAIASSSATRRADDQRHRHVAEHAGKLHRVVVELIHA